MTRIEGESSAGVIGGAPDSVTMSDAHENEHTRTSTRERIGHQVHHADDRTALI